MPWAEYEAYIRRSRNPLKSGQAFRARYRGLEVPDRVFVAIPSNRVKRSEARSGSVRRRHRGRRNPLKSGQAFRALFIKACSSGSTSRNPLKSGQAFRAIKFYNCVTNTATGRNPLKSGQAFRDSIRSENDRARRDVAIPSNRVKRSEPGPGGQNSPPLIPSQSPQIGSSVQSQNRKGPPKFWIPVAIPSNRVKRSEPS